MQRLTSVVLASLILVGGGWAQGRLRSSGTEHADDGNKPAATSGSLQGPALNASLSGRPMKLIASAASLEDIDVNPTDINAAEVHSVLTSVSVAVSPDPARSFIYLCTGATVFWQQVPSASPLFFRGILLVHFDTSFFPAAGGFSEVFVFESVREFETSSRTVNHVPTPNGCGAIDEATMKVFLASRFGLSDSDALSLARKIIRGPMQLTVGFVARLGSVSDFDFSSPGLQVWSD